MYEGEVAIQKASEHVQEPDAYNIWNKKQSVLNAINDEFNYFINASLTSLPLGMTTLN